MIIIFHYFPVSVFTGVLCLLPLPVLRFAAGWAWQGLGSQFWQIFCRHDILQISVKKNISVNMFKNSSHHTTYYYYIYICRYVNIFGAIVYTQPSAIYIYFQTHPGFGSVPRRPAPASRACALHRPTNARCGAASGRVPGYDDTQNNVCKSGEIYTYIYIYINNMCM